MPNDLAANPRVRQYEMGIIMGPVGHGKTALAEPLVEDYRRKGGRVFIVDGNNNWPGYPDRITSLLNLDEQLWKLKTNGPGMIVFEDAHTYMRHPTDARLDIMTGFRHWQKDVLMICHRPAGIPKDAIENAAWLALFAFKEVYSRKYMGSLLGPDIMQHIPKKGERFKFLYLRQDSNKLAYGYTMQRKTATASDKGA